MSSIEHQIIESCRFIDDYLTAHPFPYRLATFA
jgi:hypothetical protein